MHTRFVAMVALLAGCKGSGDAGAVDAAASDADVDAADAADADVGAVDAAPVDAGSIICGANTCALPGQVCCAELDGGTCFDRDAAPCVPVQCDEPGDCPTGTECCYEFHDGCGVGSRCLPACNGNTVPACQSLADCTACVRLTCGALSLRTCGTDGICCK